MTEALGDLGGAAVGNDPPACDEHDPLAEALDLGHVVGRDEQRGAVLVTDGAQPVPHTAGDVGVERRRGLVEHEQPRPVQRGPDDPDQRPLARGELRPHRLAEVLDTKARQAGVDGRPRVAQPVEVPVQPEVLPHADPLREGQVPCHEAHFLGGVGAVPATGRPQMTTVPASGDTTPRTMSSVVVFPAPFGPRSATRSPACTTRSTPSTARERR